MKVELEREELVEAVKCYLSKKGIDMDTTDISISVSRTGITTVSIEKNVEKLYPEDSEYETPEPFRE